MAKTAEDLLNKMSQNRLFEKSIIVCAHPDDEVLWFSSILDKVDKVLFCFLDSKSHPELSRGRRQILSEYPLKNVSFLGVESSEAYNGANWQNPNINSFGVELPKKLSSYIRYVENYHNIKNALVNVLPGYFNVFTHNPWGEYGHEDHIQVYRVIKELQGNMGFNMWFSNYCSNKSFNLTLRYISGFDSEYLTLDTNKELAKSIKDLYIKNECWTWHPDWEWFNEEAFKKDKISNEKIEDYGHIFPLNMIKVKIQENPTIFKKFISSVR